MILVYALSPHENKKGAEEFGNFFATCPELKAMMNKGVLYTDGGVSLPAFAEYFNAPLQKRCLHHWIG
jgi:hypothetical protein